MLLINHSLDIAKVGGKAYHLEKTGIKNTPKFFVCPTDVFSNFNEDIKNELKKDIESLFSDKKKYAVRSSGVDEDSDNHSFAGIHDSFLNVSKENILEKIELVYKSAFSERAILYRKQNGLSTENIRIAVIVQEMINADFAGVINTINPITNNPDEIMISVVEGLGESLVDGTNDSTDYFVNGKNIKVKGPDILSKKQIKNIVKLAHEVQDKYDHFQDIEYAVKGNKVYFLQTRDITPYKHINSKERINFIDNSNIIESYYGVTSPLTFSFVRDAYRDVYTATLKAGHTRQKIIDNLAPSLANMLTCYEGKIYYNMKNWYRLTSIFSFTKSTDYMEDMMGVKSSSDDFKKVKMNLFDIIKLGVIFLHKLTHIEQLSDEFEEKFNKTVAPYYGQKIYGHKEKLVQIYNDIRDIMLPLFTTPIINDVAVMITFGSLKEAVNKLKVENKTEILNAAISSNGSVKSVGSAKELIKIHTYIRSQKGLKEDFEKLSADELYKKYHHKGTYLFTIIQKYIYDYGSRVVNELKLETVTMIENPRMIYEYLKNDIVGDSAEENYSNVKLPASIKRKAKKAQKYIKNRERLRLKRTYIFSVVRNIFLTLGREFYRENYISDPRDIFYLTKEEAFDINPNVDYKAIVEKRKAEEKEFEEKPYYDRIVFYKDAVLPVMSNNGSTLNGIGNGFKYTGRIQIMNSYKDELIPGSIILTKRTDPGWISLFPKAGGLIVEHGSMLSHSFVVAREMKLPAIVGVSNATSVIKDGDIVTIDGIKGEITIENQKVL